MKISVVIITHNRKEDIIRTIAGFKQQKYSNFEIIIVDNASNDGTKEMMKSDYSDIRYLWLPNNFDIKAINIGIELSDGDIIWRTDDDSFPEDENSFQLAVDIFSNYPDIHIICTEDIEVRRDYEVWEWYHKPVDKINIPKEGYPSYGFHGTGAAIRRYVYDHIGGFWEFGFEELEFSTRAIRAGYNLRYYPNIRVLHFASQTGRMLSERWLRMSKQLFRYYWKHFPFIYAFGATVFLFPFQLIVSVLNRVHPLAMIQGIFGFIEVIINTIRNERDPVSIKELKKITFGVSLVKKQLHYIKSIFASRFRRLIGK